MKKYNRFSNRRQTNIDYADGCFHCYGMKCNCNLYMSYFDSIETDSYINECNYPCCNPSLDEFIEFEIYKIFNEPVSLEKEKMLKILQVPSLKKKYLTLI